MNQQNPTNKTTEAEQVSGSTSSTPSEKAEEKEETEPAYFSSPSEHETAPLSSLAMREKEKNKQQETEQENAGQQAPPDRNNDGFRPSEGDTQELQPEPESKAVMEGEGTQRLDSENMPFISPVHSVQGLAAAALRDVGRVRENNQDNVFALVSTLPRGDSDLTMGLFVVADGMGGHKSGDVASQMAVRTVVRHILSQFFLPTLEDGMMDAIQNIMIAAVQQANHAIWEQAQDEHSDMGSTCTVALLLGAAIYVAHVGDTRLYLLEEETLQAITTDHSAVGRLIEIGQLDPTEAQDHPLRNQLYRAIGQQPQIEVDFLYQPLGASTHILLCSDGLWGEVSEAEMVAALRRSPWPQDGCRELIALANIKGGQDNISAVVVSLPIEEELF